MCMDEDTATLVQGQTANAIMAMDSEFYECSLKIHLSTGDQKFCSQRQKIMFVLYIPWHYKSTMKIVALILYILKLVGTLMQ